MTPATLKAISLHTDLEADAAWFWEREAYYAGRAAFERTQHNEHAARRLDFLSAANRSCAIKADEQLAQRAAARSVRAA